MEKSTNLHSAHAFFLNTVSGTERSFVFLMDFRVRSRKLNIFIGPVSARVKEISSAPPPSCVMHSGIVLEKPNKNTSVASAAGEFY